MIKAIIFLFFFFSLYHSALASKSKRALSVAVAAAQSKDYEKASALFYELSHSPEYSRDKIRMKYLLGLMLYQMELHQVAAYQFIPIIKSPEKRGRFLQKSLEKMAIIADRLEDNTMLNYAMSRVTIRKFPRNLHDLLFFRIGQFQMGNKQYKDAIKNLNRVSLNSRYYARAKYSTGLAYAELNANSRALKAFQELYESRAEFPKNDYLRSSAQIGIARVLYQAKKWESSVEDYKRIPKNTETWHSALFESSWAFLRDGRFRSALSNFQSLHSPFYEDFYMPESLLLRAIVYLYICKYNEAQKVLNIFDKDYEKIYKDLKVYLRSEIKSLNYYKSIENILNKKDSSYRKISIPRKVAMKISKEGDFLKVHNYVGKLIEEIERTKELSSSWKRSSLGRYARRTLNVRVKKAQVKAGRVVRRHLIKIASELEEFFEQRELIKFEMIKGRKAEHIFQEKNKNIKNETIDALRSREFYIQNGYDYWPFEAEYWLDELGSYYYLGVHSCKEH